MIEHSIIWELSKSVQQGANEASPLPIYRVYLDIFLRKISLISALLYLLHFDNSHSHGLIDLYG